MGKQYNRPQYNRPAAQATPQGNPEARLIDANDVEKPLKVNPEAEALASAEIGKAIFSRFRFDLPDTEELGSGESETGDSLSRAILAEVRENQGDSIGAYIDELADRSDRWKKAAKALISIYLDAFLTWVDTFVAGNDIVLAHSKGHSIRLEPREALISSAKALLLALGKVSNSTLFGRQEGDKKKPSIFDSPGKVAKIGGFKGGNDAGLESLAEVRQVTLDSDGVIRKAIELIGELANQINQRNWGAAGLTFQSLTGQRKASYHYNFDDELVICLAQARIYGVLAAGADQQIKEAKEAAKKGRKLASLTESEKERFAQLRRDLKIAGNKADDALDVASESSIPPVPTYNALDDEAVAFRRAQSAFKKAIDEMDLAEHISYKDIALQPSIEQFADGRIAQGEIPQAILRYIAENEIVIPEASATASA